MNVRYFLLCLLITAALLATGCTNPSEQSYFSYAAKPFHAEIRGTLNGVRFSAEIGKDAPYDPNKPLAGVWIRYIEPQSAATLEIRYDDKECPIATLGEVKCACDEATLQGLLRPLKLLLESPTPMTVRKERGETVLTMEDYTLTLSKEGIPTSVEGARVSIKTVWWEVEKTP